MTFTRGCSSGNAPTTLSTAEAPAMSLFIAIMRSYGRLSETPPVSNVIPLPTRTTCGTRLALDLGVYVIWINLGPGLGDEFPTARNPPNFSSSFPARTLIESLPSLAIF